MRYGAAATFSPSRCARRRFLAALPVVITGCFSARGQGDENTLHVLAGDNIDRLRLDFNASHGKPRFLLLLSPT